MTVEAIELDAGRKKWQLNFSDGRSEVVWGAASAEQALAVHAEAVNPPVLPPSEAAYSQAIQAHADAVARSRGYTDGTSMASYAASSIAPWQAEAQAFVTWRDEVWLYAFSALAQVQHGEREQPSVAALVAELPSIVWPAP